MSASDRRDSIARTVTNLSAGEAALAVSTVAARIPMSAQLAAELGLPWEPDTTCASVAPVSRLRCELDAGHEGWHQNGPGGWNG